GGGVPLEEDLVAAVALVLAAEEVVEAHVVQRRRGREGGDVPAHPDPGPLRARDHHRRVPAGGVEDLALDLLVAREERLRAGGDGVHVVRAAHLGHGHALLTGPLDQPEHQVAGPLPAARVDGGVEGVEPLLGLLRVEVGDLTRKAANDDRVAIGCGSHADPYLSRAVRDGRCTAAGSAPIPWSTRGAHTSSLPRGNPDVRPRRDPGRGLVRVSYPGTVPECPNRAQGCGVPHHQRERRATGCGEQARIVTVSAVSAAGYLRDPSRPCGLRPMLRARA